MNSRGTDPEQQGGVSGGSQGTGGISGGEDHGRRRAPGDAAGPPQRDGNPGAGTSTAGGTRPAQGTERGYDEAVRRPDAAGETDRGSDGT